MELFGTAYCIKCGSLSTGWSGHMHDGDKLVAVGCCSDKCYKASKKMKKPLKDCPDKIGCYGPLDKSLGLAWELWPDGDLLFQKGSKRSK
jgi:hypothetical protein